VTRLTVLLSMLVASAALAQIENSPDLRDLMHSRNMAMGGAYESLGYGAEVIAGNPSALSMYKRYQIEATGSWDIPQGFGFGSLAVADSTNAVAAGIQYHFATYGGAERRWAHLTTLALAYPIADVFHLGVAVRHQAIVGATNTNSVTMNAGILIKPIEYISFGFSGHNLISVYNRDVSRYFVASVSGRLFSQLSPALDVRMDFNEPTPRIAVHGGIEWLIAQTWPIRAGYQYDGIANHHYISFGAGWFSEGSGVDIAYRHEIEGQGGRLISLTLKLQL
jgi:hypothetical protein